MILFGPQIEVFEQIGIGPKSRLREAMHEALCPDAYN